MIKNYLFLILVIFISNTSYAQISGTVKDSLTNEPLPFVNIWVKGKFFGGTSDQNGNFTIEQSRENDSLIISYLGFERKEISAKKGIKIFLKEKPEELEEIIIIPMKAELEFEINSYKRAKKTENTLILVKDFNIQLQNTIQTSQIIKKHLLLKN